MFVAWHKPPEGHPKPNIDGSFNPKSPYGGTGGVIKNYLAEWIIGFASK